MATNLVDKSLHVGKTDTYSMTVSSDWLNDEDILTATVTGTDYISVGDTSIVDNVIYAYLTGLASTSYTDIHIDYTTATRSDCDYIRIVVDDC